MVYSYGDKLSQFAQDTGLVVLKSGHSQRFVSLSYRPAHETINVDILNYSFSHSFSNTKCFIMCQREAMRVQ